MMVTKTDNSDLAAKLELRRYFLRRYHASTPPHVLDCCQGEGLLWRQLRAEFAVASYWGVDRKKKKGRLQIDSIRVLEQPGCIQDVIDIDTYGSPWKHWQALLPNIQRATTAFLTIGQVSMGTDHLILKALGLDHLKVPLGIQCKLHDIATNHLLTMCFDYATTLVEAVEAVSTGHARYIGVRLEPTNMEQADERT